MSDTPTFASLLTQWSGGGFAARQSVYAHLRAHPAEAAAVETSIRDELTTDYLWKRVIAAEAMVKLYRDENAAAVALRGVFRQGDSSAAADAISVLEQLSPEVAGPLLVEIAVHTPNVFRAQPAPFHRWASATTIQASQNTDLWLTLFSHAGLETESSLLVGLANVALCASSDLSALEPVVTSRLVQEESRFAAGAALWRLTWRVNETWIADINPQDPRLETDHSLLVLLIEVLVEQLGLRPILVPLIRNLLLTLSHKAPEQLPPLVTWLANLGTQGWSVLLPLLGDSTVNAQARTAMFREAGNHPSVLMLVCHHAHAVILERARNLDAIPLELLESAARALGAIGAPVAAVLTDVLDLIAKQLGTARSLTPVVPALAAGFPNPHAAVARTLNRVWQSLSFRTDAFAALAEVYAALNLDAAPGLVADTSIDQRTLDFLLQESAWNGASLEVRQRHAIAIAEHLASPRPEVRTRAAELLQHYTDTLPAAWPALVALLAGNDEKTALLVLPYFRFLTPVADVVTPELVALFREPNPTYAARAVVALWRLGQMGVVSDELLAAVTAPDDVRGWAVLRGVADRVFQAHGLLNALSQVFISTPPDVARKIHELLNPPESPEENAISVCVHLDKWPRVNWDGVHQCVCNDQDGGLLVLAFMCAHGSAGFVKHKNWMIKHQRVAAGISLAAAKKVVEGVIERLTPTATSEDRRACVRDYFGRSFSDLPKILTDLLEHRSSWYRWGGLELLDAWGCPERIPALLVDRVWDSSVLVRTRALRMHSG